MYIELFTVVFVTIFCPTVGLRFPLKNFETTFDYHKLEEELASIRNWRILHLKSLFGTGNYDEMDLPICTSNEVCNKINLYESPWIEKQCQCASAEKCPSHITAKDGHTIVDKNRYYKLCEPIQNLPKCRYFQDTTWTLLVTPENTTKHIISCNCPKNAVTYMIKRQIYRTVTGVMGYKYKFACSPQRNLRCGRKEPCRLFTVRKRQGHEVDEVNTNVLCQCPFGHRCPHHHTEYGVLMGKHYIEKSISIYSGYCLPIT